MGKIDDIDMKILKELVSDASLSVPKLSKKINVNPSVVYSRIKRLVKRGLIKKFTVIVNEELLGYNVDAIVGANVDSKYRSNVMEQLLELDQVRTVHEVTGRFDLLIFVKTRNLDELHNLISNKFAAIEGITHTETFVEMSSRSREPVYTLPT
ncbi:MAG: Lrp/AsnC family transcriptional regulator [Nitrososphaerales archaeon]